MKKFMQPTVEMVRLVTENVTTEGEVGTESGDLHATVP